MVMHNNPLAAPSVLHTSIAHVSKPMGSGTHSFTQYLVRVSDERSPGLNWTVYRRYSEFRNFKLALEEAVKRGDMCSHCAIMSKRTCFVLFPHRRLFGNLAEKTLETRRVGLNSFLDAVAKHARTCRESAICHTRPLMDKFLMVNDMRYTYLNVDMTEASGDTASKAAANEKRVSFGLGTGRSSSMVSRTDRLSDYADIHDEVTRSCAEELVCTTEDERNNSPSEGRASPEEATASSKDDTPSEPQQQQQHGDSAFDGCVLTVKRKTMPNLLSYSGGRRSRSRTHSWNDEEPPAVSVRQTRVSDHAPAKYQPASSSSSSVPRHSDPGLVRNELLNFSRGSFSRGSFSGGGRPHRAEGGRSRARMKVHLSSAAKRVKRLEEEEARFSCQQKAQKPKLLPRLSPIPE